MFLCGSPVFLHSIFKIGRDCIPLAAESVCADVSILNSGFVLVYLLKKNGLIRESFGWAGPDRKV